MSAPRHLTPSGRLSAHARSTSPTKVTPRIKVLTPPGYAKEIKNRIREKVCSRCLFRFRNVPISKCSDSEMFRFRNVPIPKCSDFEMFQFRNVPISKCSDSEMFRFRNVPIPKCSDSEMFRFRIRFRFSFFVATLTFTPMVNFLGS